MSTVKFQVKLLKPNAIPPAYFSDQAAGADLYSAQEEPEIILQPGERKAIPTGISIALTGEFEAQVRPRSGMALKSGVTVLNSPGTIDADYRGEIKVLLINHGEEFFYIHPGDRIAQLVVAPIVQGEFKVVAELPTTERGEGGFGHTGQQ